MAPCIDVACKTIASEFKLPRAFESRQWLYCRIERPAAGDSPIRLDEKARHAGIAKAFHGDQAATFLKLLKQ